MPIFQKPIWGTGKNEGHKTTQILSKVNPIIK